MNPDLDTLVTALHVRIDDLLAQNPGWAPKRPAVGFAPKLSDAELITLAVVSALLGYDNESRFVRFARAHLRPWFPYLPNRDGYRRAGFERQLNEAGVAVRILTRLLALTAAIWHNETHRHSRPARSLTAYDH